MLTILFLGIMIISLLYREGKKRREYNNLILVLHEASNLLEQSSEWLCPHSEVKKHFEETNSRYWCSCGNWVHPNDEKLLINILKFIEKIKWKYHI